jgi:hypothetical protein
LAALDQPEAVVVEPADSHRSLSLAALTAAQAAAYTLNPPN